MSYDLRRDIFVMDSRSAHASHKDEFLKSGFMKGVLFGLKDGYLCDVPLGNNAGVSTSVLTCTRADSDSARIHVG